MQLKQIEAFLEVVKSNSFTAAAENLFVSQPTISNQVAELERKLKAKLLYRSTREIELTPLGREFFIGAEKLIQQRDELLELVKNFYSTDSVAGTLRIGASSAPAKHLLPQILAGLVQENPELKFTIVDGDSRRIIYDLLNGDIEVAVVGTVYRRAGLEYTEIKEDKLVFIAPPEAPYLKEDQSLELEGEKIPFIKREIGSGTGRELELYLRENPELAKRLRSIAELPSNEAVVEAVAAGLGCSIVSEISAREAIAQKRVSKIKGLQPENQRKFYLVTKNKVEATPLAEVFIQYILKLAQEKKI